MMPFWSSETVTWKVCTHTSHTTNSSTKTAENTIGESIIDQTPARPTHIGKGETVDPGTVLRTRWESNIASVRVQ